MSAPHSFITRFAPSPTGYLHKGHAYSALLAFKRAQQEDGRFILRIEDIDQGRCKPEYINAIYEDLRWLGITWEEPARIQSQHFDDYRKAVRKLDPMGLLYPCFCTRKDIQTEIARAPSAPHGHEGIIYPGTCKTLSKTAVQGRQENGEKYALRLNLEAALKHIGKPLIWQDELAGAVTAEPELFGDIVLARKDTPTSYHLSVTVDDALAGITHIVRGEDLFDATHIHVVLQALLGFDSPTYHHHKLLLDETGKRFAKRDKPATLADIRRQGISAKDFIMKLDGGGLP